MSIDREVDFQRWYDNTRRHQMSENTARQMFFCGAVYTQAELASLQSGHTPSVFVAGV